MRETIEQRASETLISEHACPLVEWQVRRNDRRAAFVALAKDFEEQLRAGLRERYIAEFVNDAA